MPDWMSQRYQEERYKDIFREMDQLRRAAAAEAGRPERTARRRLFHAAMVRLGEWMVAWGHRLRYRYGGVPEITLAGSAEQFRRL